MMRHPLVAAVDDAAAALERRRLVLADRYSVVAGDDLGAVTAVGQEEFQSYLFAVSATWRELISVRQVSDQSAVGVIDSLRNNRRILDNGLRMRSVLSGHGGPLDLVDLLAGHDFAYHVGHAPSDMKIIDGRLVMLEGPQVDGQRSLMMVGDPDTLALARRYWRAVMRGSAMAHDLAAGRPSPLASLSTRQRAVVALLARDASDDQAAEVLGISVRTLRADIADLKRSLGVTTRFAAGVEIGRRITAQGAGEPALQEPATSSRPTS